MEKKTMRNTAQLSPEAARDAIHAKLSKQSTTFGFRELKPTELHDAAVSFNFTTKLGTTVSGKVAITAGEAELEYQCTPSSAPFLSLITGGLERGIEEMFSGN